MFKSLKDFNLQNKQVLLRCGFDVPIEDAKVLDDFRIKKTLPTIKYLVEKGARVILLSHLGRPDKNSKFKIQKSKFTLEPVAKTLQELLAKKVKFLEECTGEKVKKKVDKMKAGEVVLLENLRFEKGEEANDEAFARELAGLGEFFVSDAFSVCHRNHASIVRLAKLLPSCPGLLLESELKVLGKMASHPEPPYLVALGGAKVASKANALTGLLARADHILLGGKVANALLIVKGISLGRPWPEETVTRAIKALNLTSPKLHLPVDVVVSPDETGELYVRETGPGGARKDEKILDIGTETIQTFKEIIKEAKTIVWSGPVGLFEKPYFRKGSQEVAGAIARNHRALKVAGGGDTIKALQEFQLLDKFDFISTGGGAMLAFLAGEKLPGVEALRR